MKQTGHWGLSKMLRQTSAPPVRWPTYNLHQNMNVEAGPRVTDRPVLKQIGHMGAIDFWLIERLPP